VGKPEDPEFERKIREEIYARYKKAKKENQDLHLELRRAQSYIKVLERQLDDIHELTVLAEKVVMEGTESDRGMAVAGVDQGAPGEVLRD
jgi:hypothetical protein